MRQEFIRLLYFGVVRRAPMTWAVSVADRAVGDSRVRVKRRKLVLPGLPRPADGMRILHVSDLHLGADGPKISELTAMAKQAPPVDAIMYTGDFIDDDSGIELVPELLAGMPSARHALAVLGNHDHYSLEFQSRKNDVDRLVAALRSAGVVVLRNSAQAIDEAGIHVVGIDDPVTGQDDVAAAFAGVPPGRPVLLLSHTPDIVFDLDQRRPFLTLAGHTHGGQVMLPGIGALVRVSRLPRRRQGGPQRVDGMDLHISPGVGYSGPRVRIGVPPELTHLTLRRG